MNAFDKIMMILPVALLALLVYLRIIKPMILPNLRRKIAGTAAVIRSNAILVSKTKEIGFRSYSSPTISYLVFEFPDGTRKDFEVDSSTYNTILKGEEGILTYKELNDTRVFVSFQTLR